MVQKVNEVMTPVPVAVSPDTNLVTVGDLMRRHDIGDVLVVHEGRLRGLVTDRDIVVRAVAAERDMAGTAVADICSSDVVTISPDEDAETAVTLMRRHAIRRLPVVDGDRPIGMVSIGDLAVQGGGHSALADISAEPPNT